MTPAAPAIAAPAPSTSWTCEASGFPSDGLTVGSTFELKCGGADVSGFNSHTMSLDLPKADKFRLRILETKAASSSSVELVVASYMPGDNSLKDVVLSDGTNRIALTGVNFTVKSVIKEGEEAKPFPPEAPVTMMWPLSAILTIAAVVAAILLVIAFFWQKRRRRAQFKTWLAAQTTPMSAFDQLNRDLRYALKERDAVKHIQILETVTRTFLSRNYEEPLMAASAKDVIKVIAGYDQRIRSRMEPLTVRLFGEFQRVSDSLAKSELTPLEASNTVLPEIHELIREFGEKVKAESAKRKKGARP